MNFKQWLEVVSDQTKTTIYQKITTVGLPVRRGTKPNRGLYATDPGDFGRGIYYTTSSSRARSYGKIEKSVIKLTNPLVLDVEEAYQLADQYHTVKLSDDELEQFRGWQQRQAQLLANAETLTKNLLAKGYDGLVAIHKNNIEVVDYRPYIKLEQKWWEFKETITLYHGTSSALLDKIRQEGIQPPNKKMEEYVGRLAAKMFPNGKVPPKYWKRIIRSINGTRKDTDLHKTGSVIYLSGRMDDAVGYAKSYAELGGEIAYEVFFYAKSYCKNANLPEPLPPHQGAKPVVIEVVIPYEWMKTYGDLHRLYAAAKKSYADFYSSETLEDYLDKYFGEVRVEQPIPPSMIKQIHRV